MLQHAEIENLGAIEDALTAGRERGLSVLTEGIPAEQSRFATSRETISV